MLASGKWTNEHLVMCQYAPNLVSFHAQMQVANKHIQFDAIY